MTAGCACYKTWLRQLLLCRSIAPSLEKFLSQMSPLGMPWSKRVYSMSIKRMIASDDLSLGYIRYASHATTFVVVCACGAFTILFIHLFHVRNPE